MGNDDAATIPKGVVNRLKNSMSGSPIFQWGLFRPIGKGDDHSGFFQSSFQNLYPSLENDSFVAPEETNEKFNAGFYFLKYYYFPLTYSGDTDDEEAKRRHLQKQKRALEHAIQCLEAFLNDYPEGPENRESADTETLRNIKWAQFQLGMLYRNDASLRYKDYRTGQSHEERGLEHLKEATELGHKRAKRELLRHNVATLLGYFSVAAVYALLIAGTFLMATTLALALPIALGFSAGTVVVCAAHWFAVKYWDRQGSPATQAARMILFNSGYNPADTAEVKRATRYAQFPIFGITTIFFMSAAAFFVPGLPALAVLGVTGLAVIIGMASARANNRVFLSAYMGLAKQHASPEEAMNSEPDHKIQRKIATYSNMIWGGCMGLTMLLVSSTTLFTLIASVAVGPFLIPALLLASPIFITLAYASFVIGRGYFELSLITWLKNIDNGWQSLKLTEPMAKYADEQETVGFTEKAFGILGFAIAACVALSLTVLSVMELHLIFGWLGASWLIAGGTIGGAGGFGTTVLYVTDIVIAFRTLGRKLSQTSSGPKSDVLKQLAEKPLFTFAAIKAIFLGVDKSFTLVSNAGGNAVISAVPAISLLTGAIVTAIVLPTALVLPIALTVGVLSGLASLCVCYVNWSDAADKLDPAKPIVEQAYDRHMLRTAVDIVLSIPVGIITAAVVVVMGLAKGFASAMVGGQAVWTKITTRNHQDDQEGATTTARELYHGSNASKQHPPLQLIPGGDTLVANASVASPTTLVVS